MLKLKNFKNSHKLIKISYRKLVMLYKKKTKFIFLVFREHK